MFVLSGLKDPGCKLGEPCSPDFLSMIAFIMAITIMTMLSKINLEAFVEAISKIHVPNHEERLRIQSMLSLKQFQQGSYLLNVGDYSSKLWFLAKGFAKEVTSHAESGISRATWFWFAGDFVFSSPSFFSRQPSLTAIQAITDCEVFELSYFDLTRLRLSSADIDLSVERLRADCQAQRAHHASELLLLSSQERFEKYYHAHKALFNVAKHKDIAIFLGIKDDGFNRFKRAR